MEDWERLAKEALEQKSRQKEWPYIGFKVRIKGRKKWETGIVVVDNFENSSKEYFIKYDKDGDLEQLLCNKFQLWNEEDQSWEDSPENMFNYLS